MMKEFLGKEVNVVIDRPLGSCHPRYNHYYPINYGYIPNTLAGDGMEVDAYILGVTEPVETFKGKVIAVILRKDDVEDKLVVAKELNSYTKEEIIELTLFQEKYYSSEVVCYGEDY